MWIKAAMMLLQLTSVMQLMTSMMMMMMMLMLMIVMMKMVRMRMITGLPIVYLLPDCDLAEYACHRTRNR